MQVKVLPCASLVEVLSFCDSTSFTNAQFRTRAPPGCSPGEPRLECRSHSHTRQRSTRVSSRQLARVPARQVSRSLRTQLRKLPKLPKNHTQIPIWPEIPQDPNLPRKRHSFSQFWHAICPANSSALGRDRVAVRVREDDRVRVLRAASSRQRTVRCYQQPSQLNSKKRQALTKGKVLFFSPLVFFFNKYPLSFRFSFLFLSIFERKSGLWGRCRHSDR